MMRAWVLVSSVAASAPRDWLISQVPDSQARLVEDVCWPEYDGTLCGMELTNGLLSRRFVTRPTFGTIDWLLNATARHGGLQSMFRAVEPEARLRASGVDYDVGCLTDSSGFRAFFNRTSAALALASGTCLAYRSHRVRKPRAAFRWTPTRHSINASWPPRGLVLEVEFAIDELAATVHYELYDGVPIMSKWLEVRPRRRVVLEALTVELFAATSRFGAYLPHGSRVPGTDCCGWPGSSWSGPLPLLHARTDQAHGAACHWIDDWDESSDPVPGCETCKDQGASEPILSCGYESLGVSVGEAFESFRVSVVVADSTDLERATLSRHRMTQLLAPHVTENPIFFHATDSSDSGFETALAQMVEVGFEMIIFSFGSGFDLESTNRTYVDRIKRMVDAARSEGVEVGGYDLICLDRDVGTSWAALAEDGTPTGNACFASGWADKIEGLVHDFLDATNLTMLETDGPYGGAACASTNHSHHEGLEDSVYRQTERQSQFFRRLRDRGVYVNQPDEYFFQGGSRSGMGYDEQQYSLPRWEDLTLSRAGMFDDTYAFLPTQGWMFLPIAPYHAGGDEASFDDRAVAFDWALAQYLGFGTAACYRGPHLWDNATSQGQRIRRSLKKWVAFFKAHRETLVQPVVHLRRPDLFSWDGVLHVNPFSRTDEVGVALLFNPTSRSLDLRDFALPLYYAGLDAGASIVVDDDREPRIFDLDRDYNVRITLSMPPRSVHTLVVSKPPVR